MENLTDKEYWDSGYKNINFISESKKYPVVKKIYDFFSNNKDLNSVFEVGCFPGRFLYHFGELGCELSGIDQSDYLDKMVDWFKRSNFRVGNFFQEDFFEYVLEKKYDVVFSSGFIEHFKNYKEVIKKHCDLVDKDGYIFITVPNFSGKLQKFLHTIFDKKNLERHYLPSMNPESWVSTVEDCGLEVLEYGYLGGFDFWVGGEKKNIIKRISIKLITIFLPIRWLPNSKIYSPDIYLIAKK